MKRIASFINAALGTVNLRLISARTHARLVSQQGATPPPVPAPAPPLPAPPTYREMCLEALGWDGTFGNNCLYWSFPRTAPETERLYQVMAEIKYGLFRKYTEAVHAEGVEGAFVEFGVFDGSTLCPVVQRRDELGLSTPVYGFDSFEGLPPPSACDCEDFRAGQFASPLQLAAERLGCAARKNVRLVKGWFNQTLTSEEVASDPNLRKIAFAHVDCDVYSSAVDCLHFLTDRLADGAFLIFDDWLPSPALGETRAFFEWYATARRLYRFEHLACLERGSVHLRVRRVGGGIDANPADVAA
jgi:hypothetical protein